jgi:hypothetical protein
VRRSGMRTRHGKDANQSDQCIENVLGRPYGRADSEAHRAHMSAAAARMPRTGFAVSYGVSRGLNSANGPS